MRDEVIDFIQTLDIGGFNISDELPWNESGTALYIKNLKKIYVDIDQITSEPLITTFSGLNVTNHITIVRIFFANDAKQVPANYSDVVAELTTAKNADSTANYHRRECVVSTNIEADRLVTILELRFIKLT